LDRNNDGDVMAMEGNEKKRINVGVLIGKMNTYHPRELVHGIYRAAKDCDVNVIYMLGAQRTQDDSLFYEFGDVRKYDYQMNTVYDYANLSGVDALIISFGTICVNLSENGKAKFLEKFAEIPYIVLEDETKGNFIISDNYQGMKAAVEHLIEDHKYTRIGFIAGPDGNMDAMQRKCAYEDAMKAHELGIPEGYVIEGDFSAASGITCTTQLLDAYPDLEAIVCANDEMALGAYQTCRQRGLRVGEDIAITGYDNCEAAQDTDPPMTTVEQNGYDMGYRALKEAVRLVDNEERIALRLPAVFYKRGSCGCMAKKKERRYAGRKPEYFLEHLDGIVSEITDKVVLNKENAEVFDMTYAYIKELLEFVIHEHLMTPDEEFDKNHLVHLMRRVTNGKYSRYISISVLLKEINHIFQYLIPLGKFENRTRLFRAVTEMNEFSYSSMLRQKERGYMDYQMRTSMNPFFERKLMENIHDEQKMYYDALDGLKLMGVRGAMICVTKDVITCKTDKEWKCPKELMLAAYFNSNNMVSFAEKERRVITAEDGLLKLFSEREHQCYMAFPLFAGEYHYGLLICDVDPDDLFIINIYTLTLGSVMRFMQLSRSERRVQQKLEKSMRLLEEKNQVLSFISAYDELTGMLNRRGFGEKALDFRNKNMGRNAYFIFADLDHLKEINDKFGHADGDYAIVQCARVLNSVCGKDDIVGRMGGDEFMMMVASDEENFEKVIVREIKETFEDLNGRSGKPFYVEASVGVKPFVCDEEFDFASILHQSDKIMYESKKKRRKTIVREESS